MSRLTKAEKEWLAKVQAVLNDRPSDRLGFYTIGDAQVYLWDMDKADKINSFRCDFLLAVEKVNAGFEICLTFPAPVESVAG